MKTTLKLALATALLALDATASHAASIAIDTGTNYVASGSFNPGVGNFGTGFGAWAFSQQGGGGSYLGESVGATGLPETDTWGIYASTSGTSSVDRPFTGGPLLLGQTVSINMGIGGGVANGGTIGINLLSGATPEFTVVFVGGGSLWQLNDGGGNFGATGIGFSANTTVSTAFTYEGGNNYNIQLVEGSGTYSGIGYTASSTLSDITGIRLFSVNQGGDDNGGFSDLTVVPEPSTWAMLGLGVPFVVGFARRRRKA